MILSGSSLNFLRFDPQIKIRGEDATEPSRFLLVFRLYCNIFVCCTESKPNAMGESIRNFCNIDVNSFEDPQILDSAILNKQQTS